MLSNEIFLRTQKVFQVVFVDDHLKIDASTTAADIEDWDSLNHMKLIVSIENEFGVRFKAREISELSNVGEMCLLIGSKYEK